MRRKSTTKQKSSKAQSKSAAKEKPRKQGARKLRVAQLHWGYPPIIGGVETHLATMLPTMAEMGHKVFLLSGSVEACKKSCVDRGVKVRRSPLMDLNWLSRRGVLALDDEVQGVFTNFIRTARPDIVHAHNMHYFSRAHAEALAAICSKTRTPLVLTAHNVWDELLYLQLSRNIAWDHIIAVSHYIRKELIGAGCSDQQVTTVHHGIDTEMFRPDADTGEIQQRYPQLKGRPIVFHPARMGIAKGCDVSIKALNLIRERFPDVLMVFGGTKNIIDWDATQEREIAYFVDLIKHFKLEDNVLIDAYTMEQMPSLYACSDVVVYPSTAMEPFGLIMLEALATAKPLIVTRAGGMPEIVQDGINGFVVPIKDFEELASTTIRLLEDTRLAHRLGSTGHQMVTAYFTKEHVTNNTLAIYEELLR